jgi:hypothetical protein
LEQPFSGAITNVTFEINSGGGGRIIYLWRSDGAHLIGNTFIVGSFAYSATSSGNNNDWVVNGSVNCIRRNVHIAYNRIIGSAKDIGSEGIGLGEFNEAEIVGNEVDGVGDDPIGVHFSSHVTIRDNHLSSVDGRLFVSNSQDISIRGNTVERIASHINGRFYPGIALVYVGYEIASSNSYGAPQRISIRENVLRYPADSIDDGAAIYLYGVKDVVVANNDIENNSSKVRATAVHVLPMPFSGTWSDPAGSGNTKVARVANVEIIDNTSKGRYPLDFVMTGNCIDYGGYLRVRGNQGRAFRFYCESDESGNIVMAGGT